jgi:imidazoleglycerol-phosphate dehydratase/histidinol-phosphatase
MENKLKRALFIDRDGTIVVEPPVDLQLDSFEKLEFVPGAIGNLSFIARTLDFELVMVTNQDGLGTPSFPTETFTGPHNLILKTLAGEGVNFDDIVIDKTFENEHKPTRKPGTELLGRYTSGDYDLAGSFVIGDRLTDVRLAHNLGAKGHLPHSRHRARQERRCRGIARRLHGTCHRQLEPHQRFPARR